jgi:hypothetical protein
MLIDQPIDPADEEKQQDSSAIHFTPVSDTHDADDFF